MICQRLAPSAARMLISLLRESERARSRFATLTPATSKTQPGIAHNMSSAERASPTIALISGRTFAAVFDFDSGHCWCQWAVIGAVLGWAWRSETAVFNRAMHR